MDERTFDVQIANKIAMMMKLSSLTSKGGIQGASFVKQSIQEVNRLSVIAAETLYSVEGQVGLEGGLT
eukprot:6887844-Pyramimonas_sp.AAC.1